MTNLIRIFSIMALCAVMFNVELLAQNNVQNDQVELGATGEDVFDLDSYSTESEYHGSVNQTHEIQNNEYEHEQEQGEIYKDDVLVKKERRPIPIEVVEIAADVIVNTLFIISTTWD